MVTRCSLALAVVALLASDVFATAKLSKVRLRKTTAVTCGGGHCLETELTLEWRRSGEPRQRTTKRHVIDHKLLKSLEKEYGKSARRAYRSIAYSVRKALQSKDDQLSKAASKALGDLREAGLARTYKVNRDVELDKRSEKVVARIADRFWAETGKMLVVTSGTRGPERQAAALYDKRTAGGRIVGLYRDRKAAQDIEDAYQKGVRRGEQRKQVIARMARVLSRQVAGGTYISAHMRSNAVDVRSRTMTGSDKVAFRRACRAESVKVLQEARPPHFHLTLPKR